jgi:predicted transcriptional regulator
VYLWSSSFRLCSQVCICCPSYFITLDCCVLDYLRKVSELSTPVTGGFASGNTCTTGQENFKENILKTNCFCQFEKWKVLLLALKDNKTANKNRSSLDIVREVLSIALVKVCKTRIMYGANLSFLQLEKYLRMLLGNALLSFDGESGYLTTTSGKEFLELYEDHLKRYTHLRGEVEKNAKDRQHLENMCGFGKNDLQ